MIPRKSPCSGAYKRSLDAWNEADHPRSENGRFGSGGSSSSTGTKKFTTPSGHEVRKSDLKPEGGGELYNVKHPDFKEKHSIVYGGNGEVKSHTRTYYAKAKTPDVRGKREEIEHREQVDPATSEKKYKKIHEGIRSKK